MLQAVSHLPKPSVVRFDPNDPNFILGVPEEPASATSTEVAKDGKKVGCVYMFGSYKCTVLHVSTGSKCTACM